MPNRYTTISNQEGQYEQGSDNKVLLNKLHIIEPSEIDDLELDLLDQVTDEVLSEVGNDQMLTAADIAEWHRKWLGNVYAWAGKYRSVNPGKDKQLRAS